MKKVILIAGLLALSYAAFGSLNNSASEEISLTQVEPQYPVKARIHGVEGWVLLQYDVNSTGFIENVKVLDSQPLGVFDQEAVRALRKWKYNSQNGKAVEQTGNRVHIAFNLE